MDPSVDLETNLDNFSKLSQDLASCSEKFSDEHQTIILLNVLPDTFKDVRNAIEYDRDSLTIEIVANSLRIKNLDIQKQNLNSVKGEGLNKLHRILRHKIVPYTPQQNRVAERMNRTLLYKVRCMMISSGLPRSFWGEAVMIACHIVNLTPSAALNDKTTFEMWNNMPADYSSLRTFGCSAYSHQSEERPNPHSEIEVESDNNQTQTDLEESDETSPEFSIEHDFPVPDDSNLRNYQLARDRVRRNIRKLQR
ncbi:Integrase catalytic domain-containing protein [Abeliophyllum distichum]|uniref:Integrase catalytic domain-containing protein n=1 Tax=Abeliophyllum distichum TaxID=126358 RepID=A0ABD1Q5S4_9LAMI